MGTFTFKWESSLDSTRRIFVKWMRGRVGRVSYFYSIEANEKRGAGYHVHSLWADCRSVFRREAWASWFEKYGRARIEPVRSQRDSEAYASKYLCKPNAWWDVYLQWHRLRALRGQSFTLESSSSPGGVGPAAVTGPLPVPQSEFPFTPEVFNLYSERVGDCSSGSVGDTPAPPARGVVWREREPGLWERS